MIRVAACGNIAFEEGDLEGALQSCARSAGVEDVALTEYDTALAFMHAYTDPASDGPIDLLISANDLTGVSGISMVSELRESDRERKGMLHIVLCAPNSDCAYDASVLGVDGFLVEPVSQTAFDRVVGRQLTAIAALHENSAAVRFRDQKGRVVLSRLAYVTTEDHDQVFHAIDGASAAARMSLRDVYALLEDDGRFFKAGSSIIVNLDYVSSYNFKDGAAVLINGVELSVPVRLRKEFGEALLARSAISA